MMLGRHTLRRGDVVYARPSVNGGATVPPNARGVVVDAYAASAVVAFRWGEGRRLLCPRADDIDGEWMGEVRADDIRR